MPVAARAGLARPHRPSLPPTRSYATVPARPSPTPAQQLARLAELIRLTNAESTKAGKAALVKQYPDLHEILSLAIRPKVQFHLSPRVLTEWILEQRDRPPIGKIPTSIEALLATLGQDSCSMRKEIARGFLVHHGVIIRGEWAGDLVVNEGYQTFLKVLDRRLGMGVGWALFKDISWPEMPATRTKAGSKTLDKPSAAYVGYIDQDGNPGRAEFSCALAQVLNPPHEILFQHTKRTPASRWFASRKLDGVRCLAFVDILVPDDTTAAPRVVQATLKSRTGNPFTSLSKIEIHLGHLATLPLLRTALAHETMTVEPHPEGKVKRLVFDGELVVLANPTPPPEHERDGIVAKLDSHAQDHSFVEDFSAAVSQVRRKVEQVENPVYCVFDVLRFSEFVDGSQKQGAKPATTAGRGFASRINELYAITQHLAKHDPQRVVAVQQHPVPDVPTLDGLIERSGAAGWEGLILRADKPYRGRRSPDIRKIKSWLDAEYKVVAMDTSTMRLPLEGAYAMREACSNVWIEHKGHRVSVGSGFSAEQRLAFAKDPSLVVGRQITVEYFGESQAADREQGVVSLRFPRVKKVWEGEGRDV